MTCCNQYELANQKNTKKPCDSSQGKCQHDRIYSTALKQRDSEIMQQKKVCNEIRFVSYLTVSKSLPFKYVFVTQEA
uniref:Uncharacterized protein n=1 Tax=Monodelphis domestica TaxID=13616 RepID=A0A5F8G9X8_MONDO